jgi:hypothetical protein
MHRIRRVRRLIGDLVKTLAGISVYLGVTGAIAFATIHVIATTAELKCEVCADPALLPALLTAGSRRDEAPEAALDLMPDTPLRGSLSAE